MNFEDRLQKLAEENNIAFKKCNQYHIQLKGVFTINVYEGKSKYYINGANNGSNFNKSNPMFLINLALAKGKNAVAEKTKRKNFPRTKKLVLWQRNPTCFYCKGLIDNWEISTIEHMVPLSKGGSNRNDNLALSHLECNQERGSSMKIKE